MASFEQGKNKKWSVRFRFIEFGKVKNKRLSGFNTKKEADKAYSEFMMTHKSGKKSNYKDMTINELYKNYLEWTKTKVRITTLYSIETNFGKHLLPVFGNMQVFKVSKKDILDWQNIMNTSNYSYNTKKNLRTYLSAMFRFATLYYDLPVNPVLQVESFRRTKVKKEMQVWSRDEFLKFIHTFDDLLYKTLFCFLYLTGCRRGEALALSWEKINFKTNIVTIDRNITKKVKDKPYEIVAPKTGERRQILLSNNLILLLKELKDKTFEDDKDFVFGGKHPLAETSVARVFEKHIALSGVKKIRIHDLRHSHASLLISNGESIVMVSKRLGHASIEQTLNTYSHLMPNEEEKMLKKIEFEI